MKERIVEMLKDVYKNVRTSRIKLSGIIATRALVIVILVPILLVITSYVLAFKNGYVSDEVGKIIDVGIKIIDHIFIPSVLTALVGFLALFIDNNNDGVPDKLEELNKINNLNSGGNQNGKSIN